MLSGNSFIYFGPEKWDGLWRNRHQLMTRFAKNNRVLYIEPRMRLKKLRTLMSKGEIQWSSLINDYKRNRISKYNKNLYIYHSPIFAPVSDRFPLNKVTVFFWKTILKKTLKRLGFTDPIIWFSRPSMVELLGGWNEKLIIYHVVDEYQAYSMNRVVKKSTMSEFERRMLAKADLVIVVSPKLFENKKAFNNETYLVPNAVDYKIYSKAMDSNTTPPDEMLRLTRPIIGYSGLVAGKLDFKLLNLLSRIKSNWSIVLIGTIDARHCSEDIQKLKQAKNVYLLGNKDISQVPNYIKMFDVCLAPYRVNEHSHNMSPLKIYDYLAAGKPIVTTDFPAARSFDKVIYVSESRKQFIQYVEQALAEHDPSLKLKRQKIASQNTWDDRIEQISQLIQSRLS